MRVEQLLRIFRALQTSCADPNPKPLPHPSARFTMEVERNASLPFIGVELLNLAPRIKTKVYVKPTNTGLLLHYQSHVDNRYKCSLITTILDRAYRISSDWSYFSQECDRLETVFLKLKYPSHLSIWLSNNS